jgi:hypothetical protein
MIERRLAHYEITAHLGSGGIGDVHQCHSYEAGSQRRAQVSSEAFADNAERAA